MHQSNHPDSLAVKEKKVVDLLRCSEATSAAGRFRNWDIGSPRHGLPGNGEAIT
jgi:hypothetical protein